MSLLLLFVGEGEDVVVITVDDPLSSVVVTVFVVGEAEPPVAVPVKKDVTSSVSVSKSPSSSVVVLVVVKTVELIGAPVWLGAGKPHACNSCWASGR